MDDHSDRWDSEAEFTLMTRDELETTVRRRTEALENVMDTMVDVLLKLGPDGRIQLANAAVETKLGYDTDEVTGKPVDHLLATPDQVEEVDTLTDGEFVSLLVREGSVTDREVAFVTSADTVIPMSLSASVMRGEDGIAGLVCVAKDITERKAAEEKAEFLHSLLRHDMGNKLQVIEGYLTVLAESDLAGTQREHLESARQAVDEAHELLEKVRMLSRMEADEEPTSSQLADHVSTALDRNENLAEQRGFELVRPDDARATVRAGPLLTEVLANLVENSLKHSGGSTVRVSVSRRGEDVVVVVADDGDGIPESDRERIFERGYSGRDSSGSGLGMYIVSEVIESYGGSIEVTGSDSGGSRFEITLQRS